MLILGISGSLRVDSLNTQLLRTAQELLPAGGELDLWEGLRGIPPYDQDEEHDPPQTVEELRSALAAADAVLIATPEYNSSIPGQLKNALDWASRPLQTNALRNKPVAVIGASTGAFGAAWAQAELRKVLARIGARVIEAGVAHANAQARDPAEARPQLLAVVDALVAEARLSSGVALAAA